MKAKLIILLLLMVPLSGFSETAVIVHPGNANAVSQDDVKRMFLGKKSSFADGSKASVFNLKTGNGTRDHFSKAVLGKSSSQLKAYWSKLVFTGKGTPPEELDGDAAAIAKVSNDASAIAYVDAASVTDAVKVVLSIP